MLKMQIENCKMTDAAAGAEGRASGGEFRARETEPRMGPV